LREKKILLVEPDFPFPNKSKNKANGVHKNFVPIGLLKLGAVYGEKGCNVKLVRGKKGRIEIGFTPDEILVTSLFTYWSSHVWDCIKHYRELFPSATIQMGGIYATLHADKPKLKELAKQFKVKVIGGVNHEAEKHLPDYSLLPNIDYHATHIMRGCIRRCNFCGTWRIEPKLTAKSKDEIIKELKKVGKNRVIFYDNNILANPQIKEILKEFAELKIKGKSVSFESQSGFDGRLLEKDPELAMLIKKARFANVRIAWDNSLDDQQAIKKQIDNLVEAGYAAKDLSVFMIYNFDVPYEDMIQKIEHCEKMGVQITDCRYRPLKVDYDNYKPHMKKGQPEGSFYIHKEAGWTDKKIRDFRRKVRQHNIEIRYAKDKGLKYDHKMERWSSIHNTFKFFNLGTPPLIKDIEESLTLQARIKKLNRLKELHKKSNIAAPDFSGLTMVELDKKIDNLYETPDHLSNPKPELSRSVLSRASELVRSSFASLSSH